jgi:hypothetical protein
VDVVGAVVRLTDVGADVLGAEVLGIAVVGLTDVGEDVLGLCFEVVGLADAGAIVVGVVLGIFVVGLMVVGAGERNVVGISHSSGLHAGPHIFGNSSPTCLQELYSDFEPPSADCNQVILWPHVYVPAPSVTGVFQTAIVQVEHLQ